MKRALLIAGGTVGGLGAVLAITPPQLGASGSLNIAGGAALGSTGTNSTASASSSVSSQKAVNSASATSSASSSNSATSKAVATKAAATSSAKAAATQASGTHATAPQAAATETASATPSATKTADPTPSATKSTVAPAPSATKSTVAPAPSSKSVTGTFTGPAIFVNYGTVQVKITVTNGRITDAVAVQAPSGRNDRYTRMAVPILKQQTLAAQSDKIQGASGASYTSYGWYKSLQGALADAGL